MHTSMPQYLIRERTAQIAPSEVVIRQPGDMISKCWQVHPCTEAERGERLA